MHPNPFRSAPISRRRVLSLAAAATALAVATAPARRLAAQVTPPASPVPAPATVGTPVAGTPTAAPLPLSSTLDADASPQFRAVVEALVAAMQAHQVPGAAIGLLAGDREEHATVGLASLSSLRPVTPETLFQIGSLSKTYTSTAIWHLIDAGVLALDAPVRTYIPELTLMDDEAAARVIAAGDPARYGTNGPCDLPRQGPGQCQWGAGAVCARRGWPRAVGLVGPAAGAAG